MLAPTLFADCLKRPQMGLPVLEKELSDPRSQMEKYNTV